MMFSSLPSASKIYVNSTSKARQKNVFSGKKKRKKHSGNHTGQGVKETVTLVASASCSKSPSELNLSYSDKDDDDTSDRSAYCDKNHFVGYSFEDQNEITNHGTEHLSICSSNNNNLKFIKTSIVDSVKESKSTNLAEELANKDLTSNDNIKVLQTETESNTEVICLDYNDEERQYGSINLEDGEKTSFLKLLPEETEENILINDNECDFDENINSFHTLDAEIDSCLVSSNMKKMDNSTNIDAMDNSNNANETEGSNNASKVVGSSNDKEMEQSSNSREMEHSNAEVVEYSSNANEGADNTIRMGDSGDANKLAHNNNIANEIEDSNNVSAKTDSNNVNEIEDSSNSNEKTDSNNVNEMANNSNANEMEVNIPQTIMIHYDREIKRDKTESEQLMTIVIPEICNPDQTFEIVNLKPESLIEDSSCKISDLNNKNTGNFDQISMSSDCCMSSNIFDERGINVSDDIMQCSPENDYIQDESELNTTRDSEYNAKSRSYSPEISELSCTESITCDSKNMYFNNESKNLISSENIREPKEKSDFIAISGSQVCDISKIPDNLHNCVSLEISKMEKKRTLKHSSSFPGGIQLIKTNFNNSYKESNVYCQFSSLSINPVCDVLRETKSTYSVKENIVTHDYQATAISTNHDSSPQNLNILPPVGVQQARLRSYVVGSISASGSLLGAEELSRFFPDSKVTIFVGTWNMNGHDPPKCIDDFLLPLGISSMPDIYAIGVQESMQSRSEWEILMQTTLGPSHVLFTATSLGVLHLSIFLRRDLIWFCSEPEEANITTRPGSMVKTKGAIAISFMFFGTSFLFINSHLTAHERKLKERFSDYEKICCSLDLPRLVPLKPQYRSKDVTSRFDNVFWCGDLNFRVVQDRASVLSFVEEKIRQTVPSCNVLLKHDQLHNAMSEGITFHGFEEGVINFIPSYKFDVGTSSFDSTKQRVPSYTDRILYRCKDKTSVSCTHYNTVPEILTSDHKPVFGVFEVTIKPGRDNIPLAAGLFKRDVYLEANRRRAMALEVTHNHKQSTICNIM